MDLEKYAIMYKNGDEHAFIIIYDNTIKMVRSLIYTYIKDNELIKDLIQDVYMKFSSSIKTYEAKSVINYLYTITKNTVIDYIKKKKELLNLDVDLISDSNTNFKPLLKIVINTLNEQEREIFLLRTLEGYSIKEISIMLNITKNQVNYSYKLSKEKLRKELEDYEIK